MASNKKFALALTDYRPPEPRGTGLEGCPYLQQIYDQLVSGLTSSRVSAILEKQLGVKFPPEVIENYRTLIPADHFLERTPLQDHYKGQNVVIDVEAEMAYVVRCKAERVRDAMDSGDDREKNLALEDYWRVLKEYKAIFDKEIAIAGNAEGGNFQVSQVVLPPDTSLRMREREVEVKRGGDNG